MIYFYLLYYQLITNSYNYIFI